MKYTSLRPVDTPPRIVGRGPADYAQELQEFLERLFAKVMGGIPAGFNETEPEPVGVGESGSAGSETSGWAAADHTHVLTTGAAIALDPLSTNTEGSSTAAARADHTHDMSAVMGDVMSKVSLRF